MTRGELHNKKKLGDGHDGSLFVEKKWHGEIVAYINYT